MTDIDLAALHRGQQVLADALILILRRQTAMSDQVNAAIAALQASVDRALAKISTMHDPATVDGLNAQMTEITAERDALLANVGAMQAKLDAAVPPV